MSISSGGDTSHSALMDGIYRRQRHFYDATRKFYLLGRDRLIEELDPPSGGHVLEVACGTGRNLIKVAQRYPEVRLSGFDISEEMLTTARKNIEKAGLSSRITVAKGDATAFDTTALFGEPADRIVLSYCLSMIPDWEGAVQMASSQARSAGQSVHIVDFGMGAGLPSIFNKALRAWLTKFHVTPRAELRASLENMHGQDLRFEQLFRGYAQYAVLRA